MILAAGPWMTSAGGKMLLIAPVTFNFVSNLGWLYFAPTAYSLFAGAAPRSTRGVMIGVYTLSMFFGSVISGRLGGLYEVMSTPMLWGLHACLAALGGMVLWLVSGQLRAITGADRREPVKPGADLQK